jgi:hypothetical protein
VGGDETGALPISIRVSGSKSVQAIDVAIEHAESSGNQDRVVNLQVRGSFPAGAGDVFGPNLAPPLLYAAGERSKALNFAEMGAPSGSRITEATRDSSCRWHAAIATWLA